MTTINQQNSPSFKYGWYSYNQMKNLEHTHKNPYIYWIDKNDKIVQITEIFGLKEKKSNFSDAIFLGELKCFYKSSNYPIKQIYSKQL